MATQCFTAKVILLVENDFILINRITQKIDEENKCFFLIEIGSIEIKWI